MLIDNLEQVKAKICQSAIKTGTNPNKITLICVTKGIAVERIKEISGLGITDIGENRVQEAKEKFNFLAHNSELITYNNLKWHLIGHLQKNKVRDAVKIFDLIHSVDSLALAEEINKEAAKLNKIQEILIQVNTSAEPTKFGVTLEGALSLAKEIRGLVNLKLNGLMTIAPIVDNPEEARSYFRLLRELRDKIYQLRVMDCELPILSMGMSQDYQTAIEEGSTMVRIGTVIFHNS